MGQTYAAIDQATQTGTAVLGHLDDRTDSLQSSFSGTAYPGSPVEGQLCYRTDTDILYVYSDASWSEIATAGNELAADMEFSFQEAKEMRVENLAADEAVAAGKDGHVFYHTGEGELKFVDNGVDTAVKTVRSVIQGTTVRELNLPLSAVGLDASNPPTAGTKGTTPTWRGYLFDATNELMSFVVRVPADYHTADLTLRLKCVLNQAETANDDIDWSGNVRSIVSGESASGTSTATAASLTDIGANNADGDMIDCDITIDYDDADNPINAGDTLCVEINRTDLAEVGGVILVAATLRYKTDGGVA